MDEDDEEAYIHLSGVPTSNTLSYRIQLVCRDVPKATLDAEDAKPLTVTFNEIRITDGSGRFFRYRPMEEAFVQPGSIAMFESDDRQIRLSIIGTTPEYRVEFQRV